MTITKEFFENIIIDENALATVQEVYFDLTDLLNGQTYKELGYDNKADFLQEQIRKLAQIESFVKQIKELA